MKACGTPSRSTARAPPHQALQEMSLLMSHSACLPSQTIMSHSFYPPLMQRTSWTLAVPFKEQQHHRGPSDSIANNYSLAAQDLKLKDLLKVYQPVTIHVTKERAIQQLPSGIHGSVPYPLRIRALE